MSDDAKTGIDSEIATNSKVYISVTHKSLCDKSPTMSIMVGTARLVMIANEEVVKCNPDIKQGERVYKITLDCFNSHLFNFLGRSFGCAPKGEESVEYRPRNRIYFSYAEAVAATGFKPSEPVPPYTRPDIEFLRQLRS